ncbi:MAG: hypothetical protein ACRD21_24200 [Vicinamibacteria bacterium]
MRCAAVDQDRLGARDVEVGVSVTAPLSAESRSVGEGADELDDALARLELDDRFIEPGRRFALSTLSRVRDSR